jgi:hypothetical protein
LKRQGSQSLVELFAIALSVTLITLLIGFPQKIYSSDGFLNTISYPLDRRILSKIKSKLRNDTKELELFAEHCNANDDYKSIEYCDADDDALSNRLEAWLGTDPNSDDSDKDGLTDYKELSVHRSNPLDPSSPPQRSNVSPSPNNSLAHPHPIEFPSNTKKQFREKKSLLDTFSIAFISKHVGSRNVCDNEYFTKRGVTKPRRFKIPLPMSGKIAVGKVIFGQNCSGGACHQNKIDVKKIKATFPVISKVVADPKKKLKKFKNREIADIVAYLNRGLANKNCGSNGDDTLPTPAPGNTPAPRDCNVTYDRHIAPIIANNCTSCHSKLGSASFTLLDTYDSLLKYNSRSLARINDNTMPPRGQRQRPNTDEIALYRLWIQNGSPKNIESCQVAEGTPTPTAAEPSCSSQGLYLNTYARIVSSRYLKNSLTQILGEAAASHVERSIPSSTKKVGARFDSTTAPVDLGLVDAWQHAAFELATFWDKSKLSVLHQCVSTLTGSPDKNSDICAQNLLSKIAEQFYGRKLVASEIDRILSVYSKVSARKDVFEGMGYAISLIIQDYPTLYYLEPVSNKSLLSNDDILLKMARLVRLAPPSLLEKQFVASENMVLQDSQSRSVVLEQMIHTPQAKVAFREFVVDWLHLRKIESLSYTSSTLPAGITTAIVQEALAEAYDLIEKVYSDNGGTISLMNSSHSKITGPNVAKIYGLNESKVGEVVSLADRGGISERAVSFINGSTEIGKRSMFHLAKNFLESLGCQNLPPPSDEIRMMGANVVLPDRPMGLAERLIYITSSPICAQCHVPLNGIGKGLMEFDNFGRKLSLEPVSFNSQIHNLPVDTTFVAKVQEETVNAKNLRDYLMNASVQKQILQCFTQHYLEALIGQEDAPAAQCYAKEFTKGSTTEKSFKNIIRDIVTHSEFVKP